MNEVVIGIVRIKNEVVGLVGTYYLEKIFFILVITLSLSVRAESEFEFTNNLFYTDDTSLFTVTRQLSLLDDPTQPTVDIPNQKQDFVYEPLARFLWDRENELGKFEAEIEAGGYVFADNTEFTHPRLITELSQSFSTGTKVSAIYKFIPDRYLGLNLREQEDGTTALKGESLTSHLGSLHIEQHISDTFMVHLLGRYGVRNYNSVFANRDTELWTVGAHAEWKLSESTEIFFGYHYERGNAINKTLVTELNDDVSYNSHYASVEVLHKIFDKLTVALIFDFEKNNFTTSNVHDEHFRNPETIFLGELELRYAMTEKMAVLLGFQHGDRMKKREVKSIDNNNVWIGLETVF